MYGYNFGMAGSMTPSTYATNMPVQPQYRGAMPINLQGRVVASVDEVRASQVALDGSMSYFPSPGENKIYVKGINMQGLPFIQVYEPMKEPAPAMGMWNTNEMEARIVALENKIKEFESYVQSAVNNANAG